MGTATQALGLCHAGGAQAAPPLDISSLGGGRKCELGPLGETVWVDEAVLSRSRPGVKY